MNISERTAEVAVFLRARGADKSADYAFLADVVAQLTARSPVRLGRHCVNCGAVSHGRPLVISAGNLIAPVHVSLSRAGGIVAVAVSRLGPVGIDIEELSAVRRAGFDGVAFTAAEQLALLPLRGIAADRARATMWTKKEAVLKLTGEGLRTDPREIDVVLDGAAASVSGRAGVQLLGFDPGPGLVGTVAVRAPIAPRLAVTVA